MSEPPTANAQGTVGQTLKTLREAQNLALSDVAARLRLDPRVIAAMESGDHQALPSALYVRGYLRGYARILGTDPENMVNMYNEEAPSAPPDIQPEMSRPAQHSSEDMPVRAATIAVIALLGVLLVVWWQTTYRQESAAAMATAPAVAPDNTTTGEPAAPAPQPVSQLPYSYTIVQHPTAAYYNAPEPDGDLPGATPEAAASSPVPMGASMEPAPESGTPPGPDAIRLQAVSDSWVEVTDRSGERIYMDFIRGGESLALTGHAPFNVLLGYAIGMTIEFNGQPFDAAPYTRAGVARFSLGQ